MDEFLLVEVVSYKGKQIMYWSYPDHINQEDLVAGFKKQIAFSLDNKQFTRVVTNFSNVAIGNEFMQVAKANSAIFDELRTAVLGVTGLKKFLLWSYNNVAKKHILPFDTKEEAFEYLIND